MDTRLLTFWLPPLVVLGFVLIGGIILVAGRRRHVEQPGAHSSVPMGRWNTQVVAGGLLGAGVGADFGVLDVRSGHLAFVPDGEEVPRWEVPCHAVQVRKRGLISISGADVELVGPMGAVRCTVSREHINRMVTNDLKSMRERGYADELVRVLTANGARVAS